MKIEYCKICPSFDSEKLYCVFFENFIINILICTKKIS